MRFLRSIILLLLALWGYANVSQAQEIKVTTKLPYDTVGIDEIFSVEYCIENAEAKHFEPDFDGWTVVAGPAKQQMLSIVNGQRTQQIKYIYQLRANHLGTVPLSPCLWETPAGSFQTAQYVVEVLETTPVRRVPFPSSNPMLEQFSITMPGFGDDDLLRDGFPDLNKILEKQLNEGFQGLQFGFGDDFFQNEYFSIDSMQNMLHTIPNIDSLFNGALRQWPKEQVTPGTERKTYKL